MDSGASSPSTIGPIIYTFATKPVPANPKAIKTNGGNFSFSVTNSTGNYMVQINSNLANANGWTSVATNAAPFTFTAPMNGKNFYRTVSY